MSRWTKCPEEWAGDLSQLIQKIEQDGLKVQWSDCDEILYVIDLDEDEYVGVPW